MAAASTPVSNQSGPLTIDQAAAIAEHNAFAIRLASSNVELSRQRVAEARGALGPKLGVGATYTRFGQETTSNFGGQSVVIQPIDTKTANASVTMPIDLAGNLSRQVRASQANLKASQENVKSSVNDTRLAAKQAFLAVLRSQAFVGVQEQALKDAQGRLEQAQKQNRVGETATIDVQRFAAQVAQSNADLLIAQQSLQQSKNVFNLTLARPIETPVELVDINDLPMVPGDADTLVKAGQSSRPEVRSLQDTIEALGLTARATEATLNPSLQVTVTHLRNLEPSGFSATGQTTTGVLALNIPIFDSGVTRARVKEVRQQQVQAKIQLEQVQLGISQEVRTALSNLSNAKSRLDNARTQVDVTQEVFRISQIRQTAGEGTYVEVIDAETQLTTARNGLVNARYDYLTAYSQLQRAIGADSLGTAATTGGGK